MMYTFRGGFTTMRSPKVAAPTRQELFWAAKSFWGLRRLHKGMALGTCSPSGRIGMSVSANNGWRSEFGIASAGPKDFFASKEELNAPGMTASQGHVLRRAFDLLELDGVLCTENTPLVYFKQVNRVEPAEVARLHRTFWNHGGAPILVLIAPDQVQIYSGLVRPQADSNG